VRWTGSAGGNGALANAVKHAMPPGDLARPRHRRRDRGVGSVLRFCRRFYFVFFIGLLEDHRAYMARAAFIMAG